MILNTGNRTDIPAFFSEWFFNRIKAGYVDAAAAAEDIGFVIVLICAPV